jgi:hypothetical protein
MSTDDSVCCQQLLTKSAMRSPFGRIISLGFYDGTTSGVAQCLHCSRFYKYELVAWDSSQDLRIYSLAALPQESFEALLKLLSGVERPTSPIWIPILPSDSSQDMSVLKRSIDAELAKAEPPSHVIASRHLDQEILARKEISDAARIKLPKSQDYPGKADWEFWQAYLAVDSLPELT